MLGGSTGNGFVATQIQVDVTSTLPFAIDHNSPKTISILCHTTCYNALRFANH
jgi:hypothetical protein